MKNIGNVLRNVATDRALLDKAGDFFLTHKVPLTLAFASVVALAYVVPKSEEQRTEFRERVAALDSGKAVTFMSGEKEDVKDCVERGFSAQACEEADASARELASQYINAAYAGPVTAIQFLPEKPSVAVALYGTHLGGGPLDNGVAMRQNGRKVPATHHAPALLIGIKP